MADFKSPFNDAVVPTANPNPNRGQMNGESGLPARSGHSGGVDELTYKDIPANKNALEPTSPFKDKIV